MNAMKRFTNVYKLILYRFTPIKFQNIRNMKKRILKIQFWRTYRRESYFHHMQVNVKLHYIINFIKVENEKQHRPFKKVMLFWHNKFILSAKIQFLNSAA